MLDNDTAPKDHVPNMEFIAHAREDVPRLLDFAEGAIALLKEIAFLDDSTSRKVQEFLRANELDTFQENDARQTN